MLLIVLLIHKMKIGCGQMMHLKKYYKLMRISKYFLAKCSWCGTEIIVCKRGCPLLIVIILGIMLLKALFWMWKEILQPCWQFYMKSISIFYFFIFKILVSLFKLNFLLYICFLWLIISCFILSRGTKNLMFPQILFMSFFAFKALLGNHFHILKILSSKKILLQLMRNRNPNIKISSLWMLRL